MKNKGFCAYLTLCFLFLFSHSALAYIDPSVTTYLIQAVAGIAIAVGAIISIYWRKARKKVAEKLNIEENATKEIEEDVVVYTEPEKTNEKK